MSQPQWITPAGSLGTIPEGVFFQLAMLADTDVVANLTCTATDGTTNRITCNSTANIYPGMNVIFGGTTGIVFGGISAITRYFVLDVYNSTQFSITATEFTTTPIPLTTASGTMPAEFKQHVLFNLQAGQLPLGIQVADNGLIIGTPKAVASIQGVPTQVAVDVTSKFTVRAYTKKYVGNNYVVDQIRDRTFSLTVTGPNPPEFTTPAGQIAQYYDGSLVTDLQIGYTDTDPNAEVVVRLVGGKLPVGLTVSTTGLISGFITPLAPIDATAGFSNDGQGYDEYSFDFSTMSVNSNYEFTLEITDGIFSQLRTFSIYVYSKDSLSADTTDITADNTFVTADATTIRPPIITNSEGSIGTVRNNNWFAYQFIGLDLDGDQIDFELIYDAGDSSGIPGLTLDQNSGWLYGYIPNLGLTERVYNFNVRVSKDNNPLISNEYSYSLAIIGAVDTDITWTGDVGVDVIDLGVINNGATSIFYVEAINVSGIVLQYELLSGSISSLPQGLQLLPSGDIAGRVSFDTFALDLGTTTFDVTKNDLSVTGEDTETTFDLAHEFTVRAFSSNGLIDVSKVFKITVKRVYNEPYDNLYIEAMPPVDDRALIQDLLQNADIFQPELLYRPADPNFGKATQLVYNHAFGLTAATYDEYVSSLYKNHYWKNLTLGEIKVARATDLAGNVLYEVIYSRVIDNLLNAEGESVSKDVILPYPINNNQPTDISTVYPNSLINMRDQVIDTVGEVDDILPLWMTSKQADGNVLGFTPACILAYVKPGKGDQVAYYIRTKFGERLNLVDFEVDRYELDRLLSKNWDPIADSTGGAWEPTPAETTFDYNAHYQLPVPNDSSFVFVGGTGYEVGDVIRIYGSQVGGTDTLNDITLTVAVVDNNGTIEQAFCQGTAPMFSVGNVYYNKIGTNIIGSGSGATWDIEVVGEDQTTFDGQSVRFIAPVDMYSNTQAYDRYLVFPNRNIIEPVYDNNRNLVGWLNIDTQQITWVNNISDPIGWVNSNL